MSVAVLLRKGSVGGDVADLQMRLAQLGFSPGPIDGDFGSLTENAVLAFQTAKGLTVDGVVGPQTRDALGIDGAPVQGTSLLVDLGRLAEDRFGLTIGECSAPGAPARWGPVTPGVHSQNSLHNVGRAFDAGGSKADMEAFSAFVDENHASQIAELIHNPNGSIKNGQRVSPDFWGEATFQAHRNHIHLAV